MKVAGNFDMQNNVLKNIVLEQLNDFPQNPKVGSFALIEKRLMVCVEFTDGAPLWIPLSQELDTYVHSQPVADATWTIPHNLGSSTVIVQAFDENNRVVIPDEIDTSVKDTAVVSFSMPLAGRAIIMMGNFVGLAKPETRYTQSFTLNATWVVNHGLGYEPVTRVIRDGLEIQPESITHISNTQLEVRFTNPQAGKVICI